jgi:hypothetical protein
MFYVFSFPFSLCLSQFCAVLLLCLSPLLFMQVRIIHVACTAQDLSSEPSSFCNLFTDPNPFVFQFVGTVLDARET